jgi:hypothetical protein
MDEEDLGSTNEVSALDEEMLEKTAARPLTEGEVPTVTSVDVPALRARAAEEEVVQADDLADLIEIDDLGDEDDEEEEEASAATTETSTDRDTTEEPEKPRQRSIPPPLPRS